MSTGMSTECYLCHLEKYVEKALALGTPEQAAAFAKELMGLYASAPEGVSAPWFGPGATALLDRYYGTGPDPYKEKKIASNRFVLQRLDGIRAWVERSSDPLLAALQCAILGNYIDFSALREQVSFEKLDEMLAEAGKIALPGQTYQQLRKDLQQAKTLLYLTDNAGEIGFDRVLAEKIAEEYPLVDITFCVRGGPAQNDATREDAAAVGIPFQVIDNGNTVAGTQPELLSQEAKYAFETADVILSKGQGNLETLFGCKKNVYYAFLVKCKRFVTLFEKPFLTPMLVRELDQ